MSIFIYNPSNRRTLIKSVSSKMQVTTAAARKNAPGKVTPRNKPPPTSISTAGNGMRWNIVKGYPLCNDDNAIDYVT